MVLFADYMKQQGVINRQMPKPDAVAMTVFETETGHAVQSHCANTINYPAISAGIILQKGCLQPKVDERSWFERLFSD